MSIQFRVIEQFRSKQDNVTLFLKKPYSETD